MKMIVRMRTLLFTILLLTFVQSASAQEWSQWRGPARDGSVPAKSSPSAWPNAFRESWRVEVGEGYSSPVISGDRVFVHARRDPEEIVFAINLKDGKVIWQKNYPATYKKNQYAVEMAKGPHATPLVLANRLFTLGASGVVVAWDTATGRELWRRDFSNVVDTSKLFCGTAASPIAVDGRVVVQVGSDIHGGKIMSLDPATGTTVWEWTGPGPGYASPVVIEVSGSKQLVALTQESIVGIDTKTAKELWSIAFPDEWHENITTPIWTGSQLIVSGTRQGTHAYKVQQTADKWTATESWKNADVAMYMSSPVFGDGLLYAHSSKRKGQFVALDATTGVVKWATEGRAGEHASILLTPTHVVFLTNAAELIVLKRATEKFEPDKRYEVAKSPTWATPVLLGSDILVRDNNALVRLTGS
jgi:outer membrane protein assembly factor BamB